MFRKNYSLLIAFLLIIAGCSSVKDPPQKEKKEIRFEQKIWGPKGTSLSPIYKGTPQPAGYIAKIAKNIGEARFTSEYAQICRPIALNDKVSWIFNHLKGTKDFRTPIDLITLTSGKEEIFRHRLQDNIIWNTILHQNASFGVKSLNLYLDRQKATYELMAHADNMHLRVNDMKYNIAVKSYDKMTLCVGLKRSDLMRWTGQVVPAQSIEILINNEE